MTIRIKLFLIILFSVLTGIGVLLTTLHSVDAVNKAITEDQLATEITSDVSDFLSLSEQYIIQPGERVILQWKSKYTTLRNRIENFSANSTNEEEILSNLKSTIRKFETLFDKLVLTTKTETTITDQQIKNAIIGRTLVEASTISTLSNKLIKLKRKTVYIQQYQTNNLLLIFILLLVTASIAISFLILRSIVKPISLLKTEIDSIKNGDFENPIIIHHKDEIGDLANSFNEMRKNLNETTISKNNLEAYIDERTRELNQAKEHAEQADKAKSEFLSSMSHELRTPLNSILGFGQLLVTDEQNPLLENHIKSVSEILNAGHLLLDLINDVLDLSKIETGVSISDVKKINIYDLIQDYESLIDRTLAKSKNIKFKNTLTNTNEIVYTDEKHLKQILKNLLSNAIKYNRKNGSVSISLEKATQPDYLRIEISDTGVGIHKDDLSRLFEPFERLRQKNGPIEGAGIGLHVAKRLITLMNGHIGVNSINQEGSIFWIELPTSNVP